MSPLNSILEGIWEGNHLASIDLMEAYLHIMILPEHWKFLRFSHGEIHCQYRALPFGLASAPRIFTKVLAVLAAHLRSVPVRIQCYLDNILIQAASPRQTQLDLPLTVRTLHDHGFSINFEKSHLVPTTRLLHLGAVIDTKEGKVYLSLDHRESLVHLIKQILRERSVPIALLSRLLAEMTSCIDIVPWAQLHARTLQWLLLPHQRSRTSASIARIRVPPQVPLSLR